MRSRTAIVGQWLGLGVFVVAAIPAVLLLSQRASTPAIAPVVLNEIMSSNGTALADEDGDHRDWIELRNLGAQPVDLDGYFLSDDEDDLRRWRLPPRTLESGALLLVWASGKDRAEDSGQLHASFRISQEGEPVILTAPDGRTVLDRYDPVAIPRDLSFGRHPLEPEVLCFFVEPSPGADNDEDCRPEVVVDPPTLSSDSGFYDAPFELELATDVPDEPIFYTTDGSYPDPARNAEHTKVYDGPIRIEDRSAEADRLTQVRTALWDGHRPDGPVPKGTVVRARAEHGLEAVASYFVGRQHRRTGLPVASLAIDADHLFDHDRGIYVPGAVHDAWRSGPDFDPSMPERHMPGNYSQRGREWERPAEDDLERSVVFTWCEDDTGCDLTMDVGVRIHGNVSRSFPRKSLRLYARNAYGAPTFDRAFFGEAAPEVHRRLLLRNSGNDWRRTLMLDGYLHQVAAPMTVDTQAFRPVVLYLNGEYWGLHNLRERYDRHYFAITHGVDADAVVILEGRGERTAAEEAQYTSFADLIATLADSDPGDPATWAHLEERVDLDNLLDYLALQLFVSNTDWPGANTRIWREPVPPGTGAGMRDGRWRWAVYDLDHAGAFRLDVEHNNLERVAVRHEDPERGMGIPLLLSSLLDSSEHREAFLSTFADHLNTTFAPERTLPHLEEVAGLLEPEIAQHGARWQKPTPRQWHEEVDKLRTFMRERPDIQRRQLVEFLDLAGTAEIRVRSDSPAGTVRVNSIDLVDGTPGVANPSDWTGTYFADVPVTLSATPAEGYRFDRWEGVEPEEASATKLEVLPGDGLEVRAVFARE